MDKVTFVLLLALVSLIPAGEAFATVGGPTYISSAAFNAKDNSVYYTVHDNGGRGCPPIIHSINLTTLKDSELKSCSQIEQESPYTESGRPSYNQFTADTYQGLPYLGSVSLKNNHIDVQIQYTSDYVIEGIVYGSEFQATITQDSKEVAKLDFRGCSKDQPNIFEGYMVPNSDAMAILISNKGDCFEGGYVKESLHVIRGIKYYDTTIVRGFKNGSATEPNTANVIAYATLDDLKAIDELPVTQQNSIPTTLLLELAAAFIIGIGLGYFLGRWHRRVDVPGLRQ